jgi:hypothetical protein
MEEKCSFCCFLVHNKRATARGVAAIVLACSVLTIGFLNDTVIGTGHYVQELLASLYGSKHLICRLS